MTAATLLPTEVDRTVLARLRNGETHLKVAADLGLSRHTVDRIAREHGYTRRRKLDPLPMAPRRMKQETSWMDDAACRGVFGFTEWKVWQQVPYCNGCPVRFDCLGFGLDNSVGWSKADEGPVFGGLSPRKLTKLQKQRRQAS